MTLAVRMTDMLRWAILGTSFVSDTMARAIAGSPGSTATVVFGRNIDRANAFAQRHGIARAVESIQEAVEREDVDAVYIGLPNHVHHLAVATAAASGKAILSEKSLTVSLAQADEIVDAVRSKVFFAEGLMYLAHPLMTRLRDVVASGRLGAIRTIHASYSADIWRVVNPAGMGSIYNLGCYPASLVQLVLDTSFGDGAFDRRSLAAVGHRSTRDGNIVETAASVRFDSDVLATVHTSERYGNIARFEIHGDHGVLVAETNPWLPTPGRNSLRVDRVDHVDGVSGTSATGSAATGAAAISEQLVVDDPLDAFDHQVRMVERCVGAGLLEPQRPSPRLVDSYALMQFLTQWETAAKGQFLPGTGAGGTKPGHMAKPTLVGADGRTNIGVSAIRDALTVTGIAESCSHGRIGSVRNLWRKMVLYLVVEPP
jgi:dihydrodiol dehydrogenase / D-xylose 1-dehydrogenase (NADP)